MSEGYLGSEHQTNSKKFVIKDGNEFPVFFSEDRCFRMIQEVLRVERLFILQIIREDSLTQLSLTLIFLDDKRVKCNVNGLYEKIEQDCCGDGSVWYAVNR